MPGAHSRRGANSCLRSPTGFTFSIQFVRIALLTGCLLTSLPAPGAFLTVDTIADELNNGSSCSLCEAINRINVVRNGRGCVREPSQAGYGTDDQIVVPPGQYDLSRTGNGDNASATVIRCQVTGNSGSGSGAGGMGNDGYLTL